MNICVFLGSRYGNNDLYRNSINELGKWISNNNHTLVFGGSKSGLMGELATSVKENNGTIIGIEPKLFSTNEYVFERLDELIITSTINERIDRMIEISDVFILFPGGIGSLEEFSHLLSCDNISCLDKKIVLLNLNGYYDQLVLQLRMMVDEDFYSKKSFDRIITISNVQELGRLI